jgi:hypothetical protein
MRKANTLRLAVLAAAAVMVSGCATTKPIWFIATPGYVEAQIASSEDAMRAEYESRLAEKDREIARLREELDAQRAVAEDLAGMADIITEVESSNRELQSLASDVERRLEELPRDTIQELVDILARHLEEDASR